MADTKVNVSFLKGTQSGFDGLSSYVAGAFYLTTDTNRLYFADSTTKANYLNKYVHTLGNLTITGYNSNLSNFDFEKKKYRKNQEGKDIGYTNGLYLNNDVVVEEKWTIERIKNRTDKLVSISLNLFKL
jgi:hypothetical protein